LTFLVNLIYNNNFPLLNILYYYIYQINHIQQLNHGSHDSLLKPNRLCFIRA
jgi:hypothetical protein